MRDAIRAAAIMLGAAAAQAAEPGLPALAPPKVVGWTDDARPAAPAGFTVSPLARGLDGPRGLAVLPNGDVLVAAPRTGRLTLLRDTDRDGVAEKQFVLVEGLDGPSGMLLRRDRLYVAASDAVWSFSFLVGQTRVNAAPRKLFDLPPGGDGHPMRVLATDPDEKHLYVGVGTGNGEPGEGIGERALPQATILSARWDGTDVGVFASGLRGAAGMAFEPVGGRLWAVQDGCAAPGEEPAPDHLAEALKGALQDRPYRCTASRDDARSHAEEPGDAVGVEPAGVALGAGVAPRGLVFYRSGAFPERYRGGAFVGLHGSWNGSRLAGFGVAFVPFEAGRPVGPAEAFLTGFVRDGASGEVYGRPAGMAVASDGALLVADEGGDTIWRIAPPRDEPGLQGRDDK